MLQVRNTKNHPKRASKEMHLIWSKSGKSLLPAHTSLLILLLRNIINGIVAGPDVNEHDFESVGNKIIEDMIRKSAFTYKFNRKDRAKSLVNMSEVNIVPIAPLILLFSSSVSLWCQGQEIFLLVMF